MQVTSRLKNWFVTSQSCLTDCELVNIWWAEDDNRMYLTEERATSSYKNCIVPSLGKAILLSELTCTNLRVWVCPQTIKHSHSCTQHHTQNVSVFATLASFTNLYMITTCISEEKAISSYKSCLTWKGFLTFIIDMYKFTCLGMSTDNQAFPFLHTTPYTKCECLCNCSKLHQPLMGILGMNKNRQ
jgi:hypothetical protein